MIISLENPKESNKLLETELLELSKLARHNEFLKINSILM